MKGILGVFFRAFWAMFFGTIWFLIAVLGVIVLTLPQIWMHAYGKKVDWVGGFLDAMDDILEIVGRF